MLNFFNQRRAWDDLIMVFLKCGCSGAGLTLSAAMAMTVVAWRVLQKNRPRNLQINLRHPAILPKSCHLATIHPNPPVREAPRLRRLPHRWISFTLAPPHAGPDRLRHLRPVQAQIWIEARIGFPQGNEARCFSAPRVFPAEPYRAMS